ncbi:hypothetical protein BMR02_12280, partial [Methylococcaceae bacterium HT1]
MEQMDLIDWLDDKRVIRQLPPSQSTQHRLFIIEQLKLYRTVLAKCERLYLNEYDRGVPTFAKAHFGRP